MINLKWINSEYIGGKQGPAKKLQMKKLTDDEIRRIRDCVYTFCEKNKYTIGDLIRQRRKNKGYSQETLSEILSNESEDKKRKLSRKAISAIENGGDFSVQNFVKICAALDINLFSILHAEISK